jgi:hypothetical protein
MERWRAETACATMAPNDGSALRGLPLTRMTKIGRLVPFTAVFALLCALAAVQATAAPPDEVQLLFGARVQASSRFEAPFATGDFDGDGKPDAVYLVTVLPQSPVNKIAGDVTVIGKLFGSKELGARGETLALAILQGDGKRKFLLTGCQGEGVAGYFESPIWSATPVPLAVAKRGSTAFDEFRRQGAKVRHDILVLGTEAGIDTALYWTGKGYALFQPAEEP